MHTKMNKYTGFLNASPGKEDFKSRLFEVIFSTSLKSSFCKRNSPSFKKPFCQDMVCDIC